MGDFTLVAGDYQLRFHELASGAYVLDVLSPHCPARGPDLLTADQAQAFATALESTGLWKRVRPEDGGV